MKKSCKKCGANCEGDYCFRHKPKKPLKVTRGSVAEKKQEDSVAIVLMREFFLRLWKKRKHVCEECGERLGNEPLSYMFDHILEKSKYSQLKYEEDNMQILCLQCHDRKTKGFISEKLREKIKDIKEKYNIFD